MLIRFSVANYLSFAEEATLDMTPTALKDHIDTHIHEINANLKLLKGAIIYGANASGKSNLLKSLDFFKKLVVSSIDIADIMGLKVDRYIYDRKYNKLPTYFEIELFIDEEKYRFGCELVDDRVSKEWLFRTKKNSKNEEKIPLYSREGKKYHARKISQKEKG
ncbi:MAG: AAA family ATPase [Endomicrobium sp.]|nr:AAA family ATPase [Endomicrobium sp.]